MKNKIKNHYFNKEAIAIKSFKNSFSFLSKYSLSD